MTNVTRFSWRDTSLCFSVSTDQLDSRLCFAREQERKSLSRRLYPETAGIGRCMGNREAEFEGRAAPNDRTYNYCCDTMPQNEIHLLPGKTRHVKKYTVIESSAVRFSSNGRARLCTNVDVCIFRARGGMRHESRNSRRLTHRSIRLMRRLTDCHRYPARRMKL